MNKLTKIVATYGPAIDSEEQIKALILSGVNVFRFNFKHNTTTWHNERIDLVNKVSTELGLPVGTLIDLQGPEIRINVPNEKLEISEGELLLMHDRVFETGERGFSVSHPEVIEFLEQDQNVLIDDGELLFTVEKKNGDCFVRAQRSGVLKTRKSLNIPGANFPFPVLVDRDFEGLKLASKSEVDFVALSFVRTASDLYITRQEMRKYRVNAKLIAKIETQKAIENIDEIVEASDGVMVARGDLGVELPLEQVPYYQKILIKKCIEKGIPVITATQMLQSMITSPNPTRAEISDVANATYDLTDAVMLSAETAVGAYPFEVISAMTKTLAYNEKKFVEDRRVRFEYQNPDKESYLCDAAYNLYMHSKLGEKGLAGFVVFSHTGRTARLMSRYRPSVPIYAFCPDKHISDDLTINYAVVPLVYRHQDPVEVSKTDIDHVITILKGKKYVKSGEVLIVLHGDVWGETGGTSTVRIVEVS